MFTLLSVISICITLFFVIDSLQKHPIEIIVHKKIEEIRPTPQPLTEEEKKYLEEQKEVADGMNEIIKATQEFLGGDINAESEPETE